MCSSAFTSSIMGGNDSTISPTTERPKKIDNTDFLSQLPEEIILKIFGYLSAIELTKCGAVSRKWRRLASDETLLAAFNPRNLSPFIKVFDELDWGKYVDLSAYGLDVSDVPSLDIRKTSLVLIRLLASLSIEGNAGITLLTIPKGLTFNKLIQLARSSKVGNKPGFIDIGDDVSSEGDIPVDKTYRIVITNNIFNNSRNLTVSNQIALLRKIGCEVPKALEATVLLVVTFMVSGERLYSINPHRNNPRTYTRCSELINNCQFVVGGFSDKGLCIYSIHYCFEADSYGIGGVLRKF